MSTEYGNSAVIQNGFVYYFDAYTAQVIKTAIADWDVSTGTAIRVAALGDRGDSIAIDNRYLWYVFVLATNGEGNLAEYLFDCQTETIIYDSTATGATGFNNSSTANSVSIVPLENGDYCIVYPYRKAIMGGSYARVGWILKSGGVLGSWGAANEIDSGTATIDHLPTNAVGNGNRVYFHTNRFDTIFDGIGLILPLTSGYIGTVTRSVNRGGTYCKRMGWYYDSATGFTYICEITPINSTSERGDVYITRLAGADTIPSDPRVRIANLIILSSAVSNNPLGHSGIKTLSNGDIAIVADAPYLNGFQGGHNAYFFRKASGDPWTSFVQESPPPWSALDATTIKSTAIVDDGSNVFIGHKNALSYQEKYQLGEAVPNMSGGVVSTPSIMSGLFLDATRDMNGGVVTAGSSMLGVIDTGVILDGGLISSGSLMLGAMYFNSKPYSVLSVARSFNGVELKPDNIIYIATITNGVDLDIKIKAGSFTLSEYLSSDGASKNRRLSLITLSDISDQLASRTLPDNIKLSLSAYGVESIVFNGAITNIKPLGNGYQLIGIVNELVSGSLVTLTSPLYIASSSYGQRFRFPINIALSAGSTVIYNDVYRVIKTSVSYVSINQSFTEIVFNE